MNNKTSHAMRRLLAVLCLAAVFWNPARSLFSFHKINDFPLYSMHLYGNDGFSPLPSGKDPCRSNLIHPTTDACLGLHRVYGIGRQRTTAAGPQFRLESQPCPDPLLPSSAWL